MGLVRQKTPLIKREFFACADPADGVEVRQRDVGGAAGEDLRRLLWDLHLSAASVGDGGHCGAGTLHRQVQALLWALPQADHAGELLPLFLFQKGGVGWEGGG